jgi:hypothetical protein
MYHPGRHLAGAIGLPISPTSALSPRNSASGIIIRPHLRPLGTAQNLDCRKFYISHSRAIAGMIVGPNPGALCLIYLDVTYVMYMYVVLGVK